MNYNPDTYYQRSEVSNSDLTTLKNLLHPRIQYGDREAAFRFGNLVDAIITEPARVNYYRFTVDDVQYTEAEFRHAQDMLGALRREAFSDQFLFVVLSSASTQHVMVNKAQRFEYGQFPFTLDTRCKRIGSFLTTDLAATSKRRLPHRRRNLKKPLTSSIGTGLGRGIWILPVLTAISSMLSVRRITRYSSTLYVVAMPHTSVDVPSMKNWHSSTGALT